MGEPFHRSPQLAVRDGPWKLLMNPDRSRVELYDVVHDPTQLGNLAENRPEVVVRLRDPLLAWHASLPASPVDASAGRDDYPWPGQTPAVRPGPGAPKKGKNKSRD